MGGRECKRGGVKVAQSPETDTLFVELAMGNVVETRQIGDNLTADLNAEGEPMSLTMGHVGIAPEDKPWDSPIEKDRRFLERIRQARESLKKRQLTRRRRGRGSKEPRSLAAPNDQGLMMSHSTRKILIRGATTARAEKSGKVLAHRRGRHAVRNRLQLGPLAEALPARREMSDVRAFSKDGKVYLAGARPRDLRK
jgi:uncharacterized protein YuzE